MVLARMIFHAKFGKAAEVVSMMKQSGQAGSNQAVRARILTDLTGRFDTVVLEMDAPKMAELIDWGASEFYTIEE
jgi:hypothetical protein